MAPLESCFYSSSQREARAPFVNETIINQDDNKPIINQDDNVEKIMNQDDNAEKM